MGVILILSGQREKEGAYLFKNEAKMSLEVLDLLLYFLKKLKQKSHSKIFLTLFSLF